MARTLAALPQGSRITDYVSLGVITKTFPLQRVRSVLTATGKASTRERDLPAHVVVYYAIALALYMQSSYREVLRCLLEGLQWLIDPALTLRVAGNSGISQARTRLGWEPLRQLHDEVVKPIALAATQGAWYRQWRLVSLDGSTMDVADEQANDEAFGRPGASRGDSAYPQFRFVCLVESGTHVLFGTRMGPYATSENALAKDVLGALDAGMLCLADRGFFGFEMWRQARATQAHLLWRSRKNMRFALRAATCRWLLSQSHLSLGAGPKTPDQRDLRAGDRVPPGRGERRRASLSPGHQRAGRARSPRTGAGCAVPRALGDRDGTGRTEDPSARRQDRLAKTPDLVRQEFYGLLMAHFAVRALMHEAALQANVDPDRLSFIHAVRVVRRKLPAFNAIPPCAPESVS